MAAVQKAAKIDPIITAAITPPPYRTSIVTPIGDDNVKLVPRGNLLLEEATRRARATLDLFTRTANTPPEGASDFSVKVLLGPKNARESVWVSSLERRVGRRFFIITTERWSGRLSNEPTQSIGLKIGDRVSFSANDIRDWTYRTVDGQVVGNFTACAITAQEGPDRLAEFVEKTRLDCSWIGEASKLAMR